MFYGAYSDTGETSVAAPDIIYGIDNPGNVAGDRIDLRVIDVKPGMGGGDAFVFGQVANIPEGGVIGLTLSNEGRYTAILGWQLSNPASFKILIDDGWAVSAIQYTAEDFCL